MYVIIREVFKYNEKNKVKNSELYYNLFCVKFLKHRYILLQVWTELMNETQKSKRLPVRRETLGVKILLFITFCFSVQFEGFYGTDSVWYPRAIGSRPKTHRCYSPLWGMAQYLHITYAHSPVNLKSSRDYL